MDSSGAGTCISPLEQPDAKGEPFPAGSAGDPQEVLRVSDGDDAHFVAGEDRKRQQPDAASRGQELEESAPKPKTQRGWRRVVRNFIPS